MKPQTETIFQISLVTEPPIGMLSRQNKAKWLSNEPRMSRGREIYIHHVRAIADDHLSVLANI